MHLKLWILFQERAKAEALNSRLKQQLADYKVPDVSNVYYINFFKKNIEYQRLSKSGSLDNAILELWLA